MLRRTGPGVGRGVHSSAREASSLTAKVALGPLNAEESTETIRYARVKVKLRCNVMFAGYMAGWISKPEEDTERYQKFKEVGTRSLYGLSPTLISVHRLRYEFGWVTAAVQCMRVEVKLLSDMFGRRHSQATQLSRSTYL
jgi:hypothetical protein